MKQNASRNSWCATPEERSVRLGLVIQIVDHHTWHFPRGRKGIGALVKSVGSRSFEAQTSIRPGDVILALDDKRFASIWQLHHLLDSAKGRGALLIQRNNAKIRAPVHFGRLRVTVTGGGGEPRLSDGRAC